MIQRLLLHLSRFLGRIILLGFALSVQVVKAGFMSMKFSR